MIFLNLTFNSYDPKSINLALNYLGSTFSSVQHSNPTVSRETSNRVSLYFKKLQLFNPTIFLKHSPEVF
jgi:hypothetical protein